VINQSVADFIFERAPELFQRTSEHMMLTSVSTTIAAVLGMLLALLAFRFKNIRDPLMSLVGILQTIPSLALLVLLMTVIGKIGVLPALCALILYALLPIVRNTLLGLESTPREIVEAAVGIGMSPLEQILWVRIPMAVPAIVSGIRTATVVGVGIATLCAFIGAGGLGEFINRGLALSNSRLILLGAIPAGVLAVVFDLCLASAEWGIRPVRATDVPLKLEQQKVRRRVALSLPAVLFALGMIFYCQSHPNFQKNERVTIGSKHFTEQIILAELMAQTVEKVGHLPVERKFDLGGTLVCHESLIRGEIDAYPEYTGTALTAVLKETNIHNLAPQKVLALVSQQYATKYRITWLRPFGFNNQWALIANTDEAEQHNWRTISDLHGKASSLHLGMPAEFAEREDGFGGLIKYYNLKFGKVDDLDTNIAYQALAQHQLDLAAGNSTDGRIASLKLRVLDDDLHYFPEYAAVPIVRAESLAAHPTLAVALERLGGKIDTKIMQQLNYEVDGEHQSPAAVVTDFLQKNPQITTQ